MKATNTYTRKRRKSLFFLMAGLTFGFLIVSMILVGIAVMVMISHDVLELGDKPIDTGSFLFYFMIWSFAIAAVVSFLIVHVPLTPINKLLDAINQLAKGDFTTRLRFHGLLSNDPAVLELTESFNKMAEELQQTEILQTDFVNNFSHEFKTPIVSIAGFAKLLRRDDLTSEQRAEYLNVIEEESLRLSRMATNVMHLTKVENQTELTDAVHFNLTEQIRSSILALEGKWSRKSIDFILPEAEYFAVGNEELLKQLWINLLDNAIKYSEERGTISVAISENSTTTFVTVTNQGKEIPKAAQERIFQKFYQADESHAAEGNGVGLAIVKKTANLHGGDVNVVCSRGFTSFTVSLPRTA